MAVKAPIGRSPRIPFAPFLCAGTIIALKIHQNSAFFYRFFLPD
jgi:prepilin signal peptidase PulO-like enzyme (type II secretory pathway)